MPKPAWLKARQQEENRIPVEDRFHKCIECAYWGKPVFETKHKGKEKVLVFDCEKHENCLNTKYSMCCDDFEPMKLL